MHAKKSNVVVTYIDDRSAVPRFNVYVVEANARGDPVNPQCLAMMKVTNHGCGVPAKIKYESIRTTVTKHVLIAAASHQRVIGWATLDIGMTIAAHIEYQSSVVLAPLFATL